jgi:hypothetical protein
MALEYIKNMFHLNDETGEKNINQKDNMSEINVILDKSLKQTLPSNLGVSQNQLELDLKNPSNYYAQYEHNQNLFTEGNQTEHHLVNGFLQAYNNHLPIKIRVDDIQLIIQSVLATCVNNNAEKFRSMFVSHTGKVKISIESLLFDPNFFCQAFADVMKDTIKDPIFVDKFTSPFSTTTPLISTVSNMMLMNTLKEYFAFEMVLGCGIPNVILVGTQDDWKKLHENYVYFKEFFKGTELDLWFPHFDVIINMFLEMRMLAVSGSVEAPQKIKDLWDRVISYVPRGSGSERILGGWIRLLVPYTTDNKLIAGLDKKIKCLDVTLKDPTDKNTDFYLMQDILADFYIAHGWKTVPKSLFITPATLIDYDKTEYKVEFCAGFYQPAFIDGCVSMNIGFKMTEDMKIKDDALKEEYIAKGVIKEDNYYVKIPNRIWYQDSNETSSEEVKKIFKLFNVSGGSSYFDEQDLKEKQKYIDLGVIIYKRNRFSKRNDPIIGIPHALKDQEKRIRNLFDIRYSSEGTIFI